MRASFSILSERVSKKPRIRDFEKLETVKRMKNEKMRTAIKRLEKKVKQRKSEMLHLAYLSEKRSGCSVSQRLRVLELNKVLHLLKNELIYCSR